MGLQLLDHNFHGWVYACLIVSYKLIEIINYKRKTGKVVVILHLVIQFVTHFFFFQIFFF